MLGDRAQELVGGGAVDRHGEGREHEPPAGVEAQVQAAARDVDVARQRRSPMPGKLHRERAHPGHPGHQARHEVRMDVLDDEHGGVEAAEAREDLRQCGRAAGRGGQRHDG